MRAWLIWYLCAVAVVSAYPSVAGGVSKLSYPTANSDAAAELSCTDQRHGCASYVKHKFQDYVEAYKCYASEDKEQFWELMEHFSGYGSDESVRFLEYMRSFVCFAGNVKFEFTEYLEEYDAYAGRSSPGQGWGQWEEEEEEE
ncbi:hypothetical protein HDU83_002607, partial [Entophlyctis luteolus]